MLISDQLTLAQAWLALAGRPWRAESQVAVDALRTVFVDSGLLRGSCADRLTDALTEISSQHLGSLTNIAGMLYILNDCGQGRTLGKALERFGPIIPR